MKLRHIGYYFNPFLEKSTQIKTLEVLKTYFPEAEIEEVDVTKVHTACAHDLIICFGGDGTLLRVIDSHSTIPTLGINFGTVGFLSAEDEPKLEDALRKLKEGSFYMEDRMLLEITYKEKTFLGLNELIIRGMTRLISVEVQIDDHTLKTYRGDGTIISTPTGSTAYMLSTGGPIIYPTLECMILNGLNEYALAQRPLILPSTSTLTLTIGEETREEHIFFSYDGKEAVSLEKGDQITVRNSKKKAKLIFFDEYAFYENVRKKLSCGL